MVLMIGSIKKHEELVWTRPLMFLLYVCTSLAYDFGYTIRKNDVLLLLI